MPEYREVTIGNLICQKFVKEQPADNRILTKIYTDVTGEAPCVCTYPDTCPASQGHIHELLSSYQRLIPGHEGTGLYPWMYSDPKSDVPIEDQGLVLQENSGDARNYILKFLDKRKKECWIQVKETISYRF